MTPEQMSALIKKLRGNMSLRDFAAKCGVSHTTIDNLERGIDPRTNKPPQIKMATYEKIISACGLPSIMAVSEPSPDLDVEAFVSALTMGKFSAQSTKTTFEQTQDNLWEKITALDSTDRIKVDAFVSGLLAADKYGSTTHQIKIAARGGGVKEFTVTDSQLKALKNLPEVTSLGDGDN